ncbi:MAG: carboxymuconolactone decarboxylase family protein [Gemmatimonadaceae bacterium]
MSELLGALTAERVSSPALSPADHALLDYAAKLTLAPGAVAASDVEALARAGFTELAVHDACAIVAYYAFVNRIADGLGVELESGPVV